MVGFGASIAAFSQKTKVNADKVLRKIALDLLLRLLLESPVDTGRFRANWRVGVNRVDLTVDDRTDLFEAQDDGMGEIAAAKFGDTIYITNNLPYAEALEDGHSGQAPAGWVKLSVEEIRADFDAVVKRALAA